MFGCFVLDTSILPINIYFHLLTLLGPQFTNIIAVIKSTRVILEGV
jgi:hypothetical protein